MSDINLLPRELKPKGYVLKLANTLNKFAIISASFLTITAALFLATFIFFSQKTKTLIAEQEELTAQIKALQASEQRLVLVKDRVEKIEKVYSLASVREEIEVASKLTGLLPPSMALKNATLLEESVEMKLNSPSLFDVTKFFTSLIAEAGLKFVKVTSFSFSPLAGYSMEIQVKK